MTKNEVEVHFQIPMSLAPVPSSANPDAREYRENQITTAARTAMNGAPLLKGPLEISLSMSYVPGPSTRRSHAWRTVNPSAWALASFILPLLQGIVFEGDGQVSRLVVEKVFGARRE